MCVGARRITSEVIGQRAGVRERKGGRKSRGLEHRKREGKGQGQE